MRFSTPVVVAASFLHLSSAAPIIPAPVHELFSRANTYNASLPNITIFATGGTIAGSASSNTQTTGYQAGALGVDVLINAVPSILNISNVIGVQVANVDSDNITPTILLNLTQQINTALASTYCQGVVVTHGTDTLEETAFFLTSTVRSEKPIVLVGAMRPATAISADGPINLLEAVTLAASPSAMGRGPMVVLNDRIASAYYVTKTNANLLDTFRAVEQGFLGFFDNIKPKFYYPPALPIGRQYFDISNTTALPQVSILYGYQGLNPALITDAVAEGAKGLVLAGMGAGGWTKPGTAAADKVATENGTLVVYSHRTQDGTVPPSSSNTSIESGILNPQKSRILLQLAINAGYSFGTTKGIFEFQ
jgi:L-asparaginase